MKKEQVENFTYDIKHLVETILNEVLSTYNEFVELTADDKKNIVICLENKGVFMIKGAVTQVAERLDVSEQTIYRYLK